MTLCEIAPHVHWLALGRGLRAANVYLVGTASCWALIDGAWRRDAEAIRQAAESLFGPDMPPAAILLTHDHPDHAGAARELAGLWDCRVWVHPDELPLAVGSVSAITRFAGPLDRWVILPALRLAGRRRMERMLAGSSLKGVVAMLDPATEPPGLPGWRVLHTPGHTPGHVAFVRTADGVAISGDALVTVDLNSPVGAVRGRRRLSGPPWYTTWSPRAAGASARTLAELGPRVLGPGHGAPMSEPEIGPGMQEFLQCMP